MESWTESEDKATATVSGRKLQPLWKKLYPLAIIIISAVLLPWWGIIIAIIIAFTCTWWMKNDEEPMAGPEYMAGKPQWLRVLGWYTRNPWQNFGKYVMGVYDRNYIVSGDAPVMWITAWNDLPGWTSEDGRRGYKRSTIKLQSGLRLPFVSYVGKKYMWYVGWAWWGFFGAKFNILNSKIQVV